jgi:retron-type reverse transcriptase
LKRELRFYSEKNTFGFRKGKGTADAIGMIRIILEQSLKIYEELSVCFKDRQKTFDRVNWTKLMQIRKETGIDWRERSLINNLYMAQSVKVRLNRGETRRVKI